MSRLPVHLDPFHLPMSRLAKCPMPGCDGGLVNEVTGQFVTVTCTGIDCKFHELHGPAGLVDQAAEARKSEAIRLGELKRNKGGRPPLPNKEPHMPRPISTPTACKGKDCTRRGVKSHGLCGLHYMRWIQSGKPPMQDWLAAGAPTPLQWAAILIQAQQAEALAVKKVTCKLVVEEDVARGEIPAHVTVEEFNKIVDPPAADWTVPIPAAWPMADSSKTPAPDHVGVIIIVQGASVHLDAVPSSELADFTAKLIRQLSNAAAPAA